MTCWLACAWHCHVVTEGIRPGIPTAARRWWNAPARFHPVLSDTPMPGAHYPSPQERWVAGSHPRRGSVHREIPILGQNVSIHSLCPCRYGGESGGDGGGVRVRQPERIVIEVPSTDATPELVVAYERDGELRELASFEPPVRGIIERSTAHRRR